MENNSTFTGQQNSGQGNASSNAASAGSSSSSAANGLGGLSSMLNGVDLNKLPGMLKGYGTTAAQKIGGLSTTQKVVGGALLVLGARYLSKRSNISFRNKMGRKTA